MNYWGPLLRGSIWTIMSSMGKSKSWWHFICTIMCQVSINSILKIFPLKWRGTGGRVRQHSLLLPRLEVPQVWGDRRQISQQIPPGLKAWRNTNTNTFTAGWEADLCLQHPVQPARDLPARLSHRLFPDEQELQGVRVFLDYLQTYKKYNLYYKGVGVFFDLFT